MSSALDGIGKRFGTHWREAVEELWRRRLRTLLTLLGLIFGVGSIVAMQGVGEGSRQEALKLVEGLGRLDAETGGRPAELFRFRREMLATRQATGLSLPLLRD